MKRIYAFSMAFIFLLAYLHELFNVDQQMYVALTSIGVVLFLVSAVSMSRGFQLYISLIAFVAGHIILFAYRLNFQDWYISITKMIGMIVLFTVIPLMSFPIRHGRYLDSIQSYVASKREKPGFLLCFLSIILLSLAVVLNIGSISTMQSLLQTTPFPKKYLARLYTTGYASYMVFSPYDAGINMFLMFASTTYSEYLFAGVSMVIAIMLVSMLVMKADKTLAKEVLGSLSTLKPGESPQKMYEFLGHITILILLAVIGDRYLPFSSTVYVVGVMIIGYVLPFLISTSFFASMVSYTPFKEYIGSILALLQPFPQYIILQFIMLFTMVLSLCGVHMMITVSTLAFTVSPDAIGLSNASFGLMLLTCWYMAMCISPFAPFAVVVAETIGEKPFTVTFKYNLIFASVMLFVAPLMIMLTNLI